MNTLLIQDTFEPYYAGRPGYASPDIPKRRKAAAKVEADGAHGDAGEPERDTVEGPESRARRIRPEH